MSNRFDYFQKEGFKIVVLKDVGGAFTSGKIMCECHFCQRYGGVLYNMSDTPEVPGVVYMPVHTFCYDAAVEKYGNQNLK